MTREAVAARATDERRSEELRLRAMAAVIRTNESVARIRHMTQLYLDRQEGVRRRNV